MRFFKQRHTINRFRGLQGIGAAMLQGTATAIITTTIPENRQGSALGTLSILLGIGPVLGPSIGGLLISVGNWRWIFWINIPFIFIGLIGCLFLKDILKSKKYVYPFRYTWKFIIISIYLLFINKFNILVLSLNF